MTTSLITGGAGFIGSHLSEELLGRGDDVVVIDDLSTGRRENLPSSHERMRFIEADLCTAEEDLSTIVSDADRVFHLAAAVGVGMLASHPAEIVRRNVIGSERVLDACARAGKPILIASSSEVYGRGADQPLREDMAAILGPSSSPRWSYACSKLMVEYAAFAYAQVAQLSFVVVRLFNTVGPRQRGSYGMVIPRLVSQALAGEALTVFGDGAQTRCFCHVADVVSAMPNLLEIPAARHQIINIGSDRLASINEVAQRIIALTGSSATIRHLPFEEVYGRGFEDIRSRLPDLSKARRLSKFEPSRNLEQILSDVIAHFRDERTST